ncbi:hypothetical protein TrCOL_g13790 [Triparma columacea]|uniref:Uncharacterized protein n=1 Tax=Triparma columacea TaxID=722753 RepID=A0A9W7GHH5_9STRA|nr:hypothetical protein TrCOL_g13790 [Triparma columacea]
MLPTQEPLKTKLVLAIESYIEEWHKTAEEGDDDIVTTEEIDIFDRSKLWPNGIQSASAALKMAAKNRGLGAVSWGNTNARYSDYAVALECAEYSNRSVHFIKYLPSTVPEAISDILLSHESNPRGKDASNAVLFGNFEALAVRNIKRFATTGRYIPIEAIQITLRRVSEMMTETMPRQYLLESQGIDKFMFAWDANLCEKAGFALGGGKRRNVRKNVRKQGSKSYRY